MVLWLRDELVVLTEKHVLFLVEISRGHHRSCLVVLERLSSLLDWKAGVFEQIRL